MLEAPQQCAVLSIPEPETPGLDALAAYLPFVDKESEQAALTLQARASKQTDRTEECVFESLCIEREGPPTLEELTARLSDPDARPDVDTALAALYARPRVVDLSVAGLTAAVSAIKSAPLRVRRCEAFPGGADTDRSRWYLHHSLIHPALRRLARAWEALRAGIRAAPRARQAGLCLGAAAFVHFHLLEIHPFADGNGRLARWVAQCVLDECFHAAVPMLPSRAAYFSALESGRRAPAALAPRALFRLYAMACAS